MNILIPLAALAATLPLVPASAASAPRTQLVSFGPADLASPAARASLDRRVARAAEDVCGTPSALDLAGDNAVRACRRATVAAASADLGRSLAARQPTILVAANR